MNTMYRIRMTIDRYREYSFIHPGPGSDAISFMEMLRESYFAYIGNEREATFDLSIYEEDEEDERDQ